MSSYTQKNGSTLLDANGNYFSPLNPLPAKLIGDPVVVHENQVFYENSLNIFNNNLQTLIEIPITVPTCVVYVEVSGTVEAFTQITLNGVVLRKKQINSRNPNVTFEFKEPRKLFDQDILKIEVRTHTNPPVFMNGAEFFCSLQCFLI